MVIKELLNTVYLKVKYNNSQAPWWTLIAWYFNWETLAILIQGGDEIYDICTEIDDVMGYVKTYFMTIIIKSVKSA